ncbi:hypothetical protein [Anaerocolumna xylanovorans]|uniref:hypothetical protein n=1 Tax=Anaerocolumna xylanovorans TaxID=100134 RepID=UPI0015881D35|nr:hypothetical protein [Anaerocolumna xylanovorans]
MRADKLVNYEYGALTGTCNCPPIPTHQIGIGVREQAKDSSAASVIQSVENIRLKNGWQLYLELDNSCSSLFGMGVNGHKKRNYNEKKYNNTFFNKFIGNLIFVGLFW